MVGGPFHPQGAPRVKGGEARLGRAGRQGGAVVSLCAAGRGAAVSPLAAPSDHQLPDLPTPMLILSFLGLGLWIASFFSWTQGRQ